MRRWWKAVFWATLVLIALNVYSVDVRVGSIESIRGLAPDLRRQYIFENDLFTCLSGGKAFSASRVNDDYCDCIDGSDEPGEEDFDCYVAVSCILQGCYTLLSYSKARHRVSSEEPHKNHVHLL